jgi:acetyl-CoA carboxylase, biotin carboxylase subunit
MNTRLQVEHCVTEEITGIDLVKEQIKIAEGKVLEWKQSDIKILGHSIECRVYAEDPSNDFLPDIGILTTYKRPQGPGIRVDDGFEEGMSIPINYDPMIGKLITKGKDRNEAIQRMTRAIDEFIIIGVETTLPFCKYAINHEAFVSGNFDTNFIKKYFSASQLETAVSEEEQKIAAIIAIEMLSQLPVKNDDKMVKKNQNAGKWKRRVCND